jgi:hypothetical protein
MTDPLIRGETEHREAVHAYEEILNLTPGLRDVVAKIGEAKDISLLHDLASFVMYFL